MALTRRTMLKGTAGAGTAGVISLAGCAEGDSVGSGEGDERTVTVLVESIGGGHDDHDHDHNDSGMVDSDILSEACGHMEFDDPEAVVGGGSPEDPAMLEATHQPFAVSTEEDVTYVAFGSADGHDHDHHGDQDSVGFFARGGTVSVHRGDLVTEERDVDACPDEIETFVVAEARDGTVVLELRPDD